MLWGVLIAGVFYATTLVEAHRAAQTITAINIEIADSTTSRRLVSTTRVQQWIERSGIEVKGKNIDSVDIAAIKRTIEQNGFIEKADIYATYSGELNISVTQRTPVVRLMVNGYDSYLTSEGIIFRTPPQSAIYVPVITGDYRPLTPPDYEGCIESHIATERGTFERRIAEIEEELSELKRERDGYTAMRRPPKRDIGEGFFAYHSRKREWRKIWNLNKKKIRRYSIGMERDVDLRRSKVEQRLAAVESEQKKFEKRYADFRNLITFVERLSDDDYWGAEVVQIVAHNTPDLELDIELIPRSGDFRILFGDLNNAEEKFDKLTHFFDKGLSRTGWGKYKIINIRYNKQVVCTE